MVFICLKGIKTILFGSISYNKSLYNLITALIFGTCIISSVRSTFTT